MAEAKCGEERARGTCKLSWQRKLYEDVKLEFNIKERIKYKLGEGERNQTPQNRREQKTKAPKPEWARYAWEMIAAASNCWIPTNAGSFICYYNYYYY